MKEELTYLSGCLIYFHYKVYKRVQKRKKEEAAKKKKKNAKKGKGKKKGAAVSTSPRPSVATPSKTPTMAKNQSTLSKTSDKSLDKATKAAPGDNLSATMAIPPTAKLGESGVGAPENDEEAEDSAGEFDRANSMAESVLNNDDPININTPQNQDLGEIKEKPDDEETKENTSVMDVEARSGVASRGDIAERHP